MSLEVCGHRVLVKPDKVEEVSDGGIVLHASTEAKRREQLGVYAGTIVSIGPTAWYDYTHKYGEQIADPWAEVGDRIIFTKYGGRYVEVPGEDEDNDYVVVDDRDILIRIREE